jgi:hypothetical protein
MMFLSSGSALLLQVRRIGKRIRDPDPQDLYPAHQVRGFDHVKICFVKQKVITPILAAITLFTPFPKLQKQII